jgi:hypothetical protein
MYPGRDTRRVNGALKRLPNERISASNPTESTSTEAWCIPGHMQMFRAVIRRDYFE